jgi:hypothetical protein
MSDRAFLHDCNLKLASGIRLPPHSLLLPFARFHHKGNPGSVSKTIVVSACRCSGGLPSLPQGSLAPVRVMLSRSILAYYYPCASLADTLRLHDSFAYTQRLRCAGAPRRPARPCLLLLPCFPCMMPTLPRCSTVPCRYTHTVVPGFLELLASRQPQRPSLPAITDG